MKKIISILMSGMLMFGMTLSITAQELEMGAGFSNKLGSNKDEISVKTQEKTSLYKDVEENSPLNRKITLRLANVPLSTFLNSISAQSKINFIIPSEEFSKKKITASLTNVTVKEALDTLLMVQGLTYQRIGRSDSFVVTRRSKSAANVITKVYTLNYISLVPIGTASSEMNSVMPQDVSTNTSFSGSDSGSSSSGGMADTSGISSQISSGAAAGGGGGSSIAIIDVIAGVLSSDGRVNLDPRTNKLIITDIPEVFPAIENILAELDVKPPQILIEAQIVEVTKTSGLDLGFEYGGTTGTLATMTAPVMTVTNEYFGSNYRKDIRWLFGDGSAGQAATDATITFSFLDIVLKALATKGEARFLGKPKVVTLNNKMSIISTVRDAAIAETTTTTDTTNGASSKSYERRRVGLTLMVTPQVNKEGYITLFVQPSYSNVSTSNIDDVFDPVTRAVSTLVRVKNGQTVVIGGLLSSDETETIRKVPFLGSIPILNWFFTSKTTTKTNTDLVIFLTPTILPD